MTMVRITNIILQCGILLWLYRPTIRIPRAHRA